MKVGLTLPTLHSIELNEQVARAMAALGAESVWVADHMLGVVHPSLWAETPASTVLPDPDAWLDPFCVAAVLGRQTDLLLGTAVTDGTKRRGADLARTALTLHHGSRRGFVLGIGAGEAESLVPFGYDFSKPVGRLEETLVELRSMLDTGRMPDNGLGRTGLILEGPLGRPQVWVAATGERSLKLTGMYGDGWLPIGVTPEEYARKRAIVADAAHSAGRKTPVAALAPVILLGRSLDHVAAALDEYPVTKLITLFASADLWRRHGLTHPSGAGSRGPLDALPHAVAPETLRALARTIPFAMIKEFVLMGNPADIAARLQPYAAAGLEHAVFGDITGLAYPPAESAELMGELKALFALAHAMPPGNADQERDQA